MSEVGTENRSTGLAAGMYANTLRIWSGPGRVDSAENRSDVAFLES